MRALKAPGALLFLVAAGHAAHACARLVRHAELTPTRPATIAELWHAPKAARDLFLGPGGATWRPTETTFTFVAEDTTSADAAASIRDIACVSGPKGRAIPAADLWIKGSPTVP
jgi:hypothetical protein